MSTELKSSNEWSKTLFPHIQILDPDGWDRSNFQFSWYEEKISKQEFEKRMSTSTCQRIK